MSVIFRPAGGPPSATTLNMPSTIRVAAGELSDEFLSRLITIFEDAAGVEFSRADLPVQLQAVTATPPLVRCVSFAVIVPEVLPSWGMGRVPSLRRVDGPVEKVPEAGGVGSRSRGEVRGGVRRARSMSRRAGMRKMSGELQAEIEAAAAAMSENKQARARASSLAGFKAALVEREKEFDRDAVAHFIFTDQVEYDGAGEPGSSNEDSDYVGDSGHEGDAGYAGVALRLAHSGELLDSSDEDRVDAECSSVGSFIDTGAIPDDEASISDGSVSK